MKRRRGGTWQHIFKRAMFLLLGLGGMFSHEILAGGPSRPPHLDNRGQAGYDAFRAAEGHKAFVIAPGGAWAWRAEAPTVDAALSAALQDCQSHTVQTCIPYALDDEPVFDARRWPTLWRPYATAGQAVRAPEGVGRGERFPDLALLDPAGKPWRLSTLRGKVVVLHFWGTWCPTCRHELPQFEALRRVFAREPNLAWIFIPVREPVVQARQWLKRQGLDLPLHDGGAGRGQNGRFRLADGRWLDDRRVAPLFPTTYVLDRQGLVVFALRGSADDWREYVPFLKDLLQGSR